MDVIELVEKFIKLNISFDIENDELLIEADEGVITTGILEEISNSKQKIISFLKNKKRPLSFAQERLWFIDQYEHNASYNISGAVKVIGKLNIPVLEKTFSEIIRRHEALRTNFVTINDVPWQLIHEESKFELTIIDQSHLPEEEANQQIEGLIEIESQKPFDLASDSLIKLVLYKINDEDHTLFFNKHHIISDGWSFSVFFKEISILYRAFSENSPSPLPELEIQYADFAVWQRGHIEGEVFDKQTEYWKNKLSNTSILELPLDKPRPAEQTFNGAKLYFSLDKAITGNLNKFSKEYDVTLFMTLLSVFKVLLYKYTGQDDICVGSPIANRTRIEIEPLIGFFVNTLALRSDLSGEISFRDLVKQVKQTTLDAYDNQDIPFEKVVDNVLLERNISYSPLVQVMMVLQNNPVSELSFGDLSLKPVIFEQVISKFDLTLDLTETTEGLVGGLEYNTDLFDKVRIERMTRHFQNLVESIISNPVTSISDIEILTAEEKHQLLVEWNDTDADYPKDKCIHHLFEDQVAKTPDNVAIVFETSQLTYDELNEKSNQLAHYLQERGVKPETLVGICVERSLEMIIGLLGILKAGGAYVPIDPAYPEDRISYMLDDAGCGIVLTQEHVGLAQAGTEVIYLDSDWDNIGNSPTSNVISGVKSDNLAYVIYTSGSTGKPKGTLIEHKSVIRLVSNGGFSFLRNPKVVLQYATISFDASIFEIWGSLCNGSQLIVCPPRNLGIDELGQIIKQFKIEVLWLTSGLFSLVVENGITMLEDVKYLLAGGDVLNKNHVARVLETHKSMTVINGYGPTESTTFASLYFMTQQSAINASVPIGKPLDNTKLYVLDNNQRLVPIGVKGELYISGDGLARGYLNQPELTAEQFIKNPFSDDPQSRLYKTGDLVKYLPDGNIEFIGRIDNQVKVRGYRVELDEIELNLLNHPNVEIARARVLKNNSTIANEIVAYVKFNDNWIDKGSIKDKRIEDWVSLYDNTYSRIEDKNKNEFIGWNSSYTGLPIGKKEMSEWLKSTIDLIKQFNPSTILEIGSGTGLLLFELANHFNKYYGVDNSQESINYLNKIVDSEKGKYSNIELFLKGADEIQDIDVKDVDMIIINSVVQYFPNLQYLEEVLADSIEIIGKSGFIIIGDVRNYDLMEDFFRSTELYNLEDENSLDELNKRIKIGIKNEKELLVDPRYFVSLQKRFKRISNVDIRYKQGEYQTEMNKYRYNVVLHINNDLVKEIDKKLDWNTGTGIQERIQKVLREENLDVLSLENVPNYFLEEDEILSRFIKKDQISLKELKKQITNEPTKGFKSLFNICDNRYRKEIVWNQKKYLCEVLFINNKIDERTVINQSGFCGDNIVQEYSNDATKRDLIIEIKNEIKKYLEEKLPKYMIPSQFVEIENIPLTPNGKIDDKMLPDPRTVRIQTENIYVAPRNEVEEKLVEIWQELLGVGNIGIFDNFFELGGHSLGATQLTSMIRKEFNIELPLKKIFQEPVLLRLAKIIINTKSAGEIAKIEVASRDTALPLSFAQERLWFIDQYEHNAVYNMPGAVNLIGKLDIVALENTFSEIIRRHEVLRTNFVTINNIPSQLIHTESKFELKTIDLSHLPKQEAQKENLKLIEIESQIPFDLANDSLIRLVLYRIDDEDHTLFLNKHHIISDGWSISVFYKEISILYKAYSENKLSTLPELEIQYADYAVWQREHIGGEVLNKQAEYWKNKLSGTPILELPTDRLRPSEQTFNGASVHFQINKGISEKLYAFSKDNDVTLFMTLLSVFKVLLYKYTGQEDICVGAPIANRTRIEIESLIGFFVNTLALRSSLSGDISFVDLVKQLKYTTLDAYDNQDIPFEKVVEILHPERNLSYSSLFQVMMVLQNNPESELSFGETKLKPVEFEQIVSKFDLVLEFIETSKGLHGTMQYNTDLFDKDRIERMVGHLQVLVESIIANPNCNISDLTILGASEKHNLLVEWNDTEIDYPKEKCIHQIFEEQVKKTPDNIAIVFGSNELTYRQLNEKSNQLAHYLQEKGVKPESLVGICMERSIEMIVGLLGILKAGGAYVPIDPIYPEERIFFILEDADCGIVITQEGLDLPITNSEIIYIDRDWNKIENKSTKNAKSIVKSNNLAYVIYTSGSTGKPKGVMLEHSGISNLQQEQGRIFGVVETDIILQFASLSFDASVWEIFMALSKSAKLVICKSEKLVDPKELAKIIDDYEISIVTLPPTILNLLDSNLPSLKKVISAGDECTTKLVKKWAKNCAFYNAYGPTENTVCTSIYKCNLNAINSLSIGKAVGNNKLYILDKNLILTPIGVAGELCVSGESLARGYLRRPELTAEKFIKNPYNDDPNSRLYKTGDLAKYLPNGDIEFLGRIDNQVKIKGFRIELGEIEACITKLGNIKDCVIVAKEDKDGNKRLVAYIVSKDELNIQKIRRDLSRLLPDYMIPSLFVKLELLPTTVNGKVDRKTLIENEDKHETTNGYVAPRTKTEQKLADIWSGALSVERIGVYDNFFELGGHSLLATQVISTIRDEFNRELPLKTLFESRTLCELALKIETEEFQGDIKKIKKAKNIGIGQNNPKVNKIDI